MPTSTLATIPALVLVCKRPALGIGKQRLAAKLGEAGALEVAAALLACALEDAQAWPGWVVIAPAEAADAAWAASLLPDSACCVKIHPQQFGNLGQRLQLMDEELRAQGFEHLLYIGSDAPALCAADFTEVRAALADFDTVLKPTLDGGVSMMASRRPWPPLADLPWSTAQLGAALAASCQQAGHTLTRLNTGFDIDEIEDLAHVLQELAADQRPARRALLVLVQRILTSQA